MVNKSSVRFNNKDKFKQCIKLRKQGLSYSEIRREVSIAKSTLNNWLTLAGLTLTTEHLNIQKTKRLQNHVIATEASRITRARKADLEIHRFVQSFRKFLDDPFFVGGIMLYEAEGSKDENCRFSNSDYRMIQMFINFVEKFFSLDRIKHMRFCVYIHETRSNDLEKIKGFWCKKLAIQQDQLKVLWKKHKITRRRLNPDYVGQMQVGVIGISFLTRKFRVFSDIILKQYCRVV